ncbi:MAG: DotU family type VI secretion system protein [Gammaproteobacteria bacterium]|nr:DotU family type VI secretion system protein [Gammaproteobacteria bacterium]
MSQKDDPFALTDADHTIMIPTPGRRASTRAPMPTSRTATHVYSEPVPLTGGLNALVTAANPLLALVPQLRATSMHPDPAALRDHLAQNIKTFEARAKAAGIPVENVIAARYALCTLLDETVASTPWGGSGAWARQSLLVMFHNETWGGEKFFVLLSKLAEKPAPNQQLLELLYICLALGFEGRYRAIDGGRAQLETVRERLARLLRKVQGDYERDLSPRWRSTAVLKRTVLRIVPFWMIVAASAVILFGIYLGFLFSLNRNSDPVFAQIQAIRVAMPMLPKSTTPIAKPRLAALLAEEIKQGLVEVHEDEMRSVVTLGSDELFAPGSATISRSHVPLIARIGTALNNVPGHVQITGHTDSQPIRSARFPSNWHLSQERARLVLQLLTAKVPSERLSAEGRADADPVAPNDSPANRARNRRVEIILFAARKGI